MRSVRRLVLAGSALAVVAAGFHGSADAAPAPQVTTVIEGREPATDRPVLVLMGSGLTKIATFTLRDPLAVRPDVELFAASKSKTTVVLRLPADLPPGSYALACATAKGVVTDATVKVGNGAPLPGAVSTSSLETTLKTDLDDAATFDGHPASFFRDVSNLDQGSLDPARFSAIADLQAEDAIGTASTQLAAGDHAHDARYPLKTALSATGVVNATANPVDWTQLKNVPIGLADGADADTTYSAGNGLRLTSTTFSADHAGTGSATTVARSDHNHDSRYLALGGGALSGALSVDDDAASSVISVTTDNGDSNAILARVFGSSGNGAAVYGYTFAPSGTGVRGDCQDTTGSALGVFGSTRSPSGSGVYGLATATSGAAVGVRAFASSTSGYGVRASSNATSGTNYGVYGSNASSAGFGVYGECTSTGTGVYARGANGSNALVVEIASANLSSSTANNIAIFKSLNSNRARIDSSGTGYFNGGTATSGADFAESVAVAGPRVAYAPGDVIVVDLGADRTFALSHEAESPLVAGVYSTKPGVLAMQHECAGEGIKATESEIPLAVVGIVPVKVCDEGGAIARGDLLVTASVPGYAKKAPKDPKPGTLLGKALGRLEKGRGAVEVLLIAR